MEHRTSRDASIELTYLMYETDLDPTDTKLDWVFFFLIKEGGRLRVERDDHVTGLFPLETWVRLPEEAGFAVEKLPQPFHGDGREALLLVSVLQNATP